MKLVEIAAAGARNKTFPDARAFARKQRVGEAVSTIEGTHHADFAGIGGPDAETNAWLFLISEHVGAQLLVGAEVASFIEEVKIFRSQERNVGA